MLGGTLGAALAFLVARYIARDWVEARAGPRLQSVIRSVDAEGWRFVAFVRLVPIFPYNIVNYLLGLTRIPFHHYVIATRGVHGALDGRLYLARLCRPRR